MSQDIIRIWGGTELAHDQVTLVPRRLFLNFTEERLYAGVPDGPDRGVPIDRRFLELPDTEWYHPDGDNANDGSFYSPKQSPISVLTRNVILLPGDYSGTTLAAARGKTIIALPGAHGPGLNFVNESADPSVFIGKFAGVEASLDSAAIDARLASFSTVGAGISGVVGEVRGASIGSSVRVLRLSGSGDKTISGGSPVIEWADNIGVLKVGGTVTVLGGKVKKVEGDPSGNATLHNVLIDQTDENGDAVYWPNFVAGSFHAHNCRIRAVNVGTDGRTRGVVMDENNTTDVQLSHCLIETAQNGSGTAHSLFAVSAKTFRTYSVYATHDVSGNVTAAPDAVTVDGSLVV